MPKVSVIMPIGDAGRFVAAAIGSVLAQTWSDFDVIAVLDGSDVETRRAVARFDDKRLRVHTRTPRAGVAAALNWALDQSDSELVVRMDADDVSLPDRLARQVQLMDAHPAADVFGAAYKTIGASGRRAMNTVTQEAVPPGAMGWRMAFGNALAHPTVIARRSLLAEQRYNERSQIEDYELWLRLLSEGRVVQRSADVALLYRIHTGGASRAFSRAPVAGDPCEAALRSLITFLDDGVVPSGGAIRRLLHPLAPHVSEADLEATSEAWQLTRQLEVRAEELVPESARAGVRWAAASARVKLLVGLRSHRLAPRLLGSLSYPQTSAVGRAAARYLAALVARSFAR